MCLPHSGVVEETLIGEAGMINDLAPHTIVIDCSTSDPASTCNLSRLLKDRKISLLDAPMNRGPKDAREGKLNIMVGGDPEAYEAVYPLFASFSENIYYVGQAGAGHRLKLLNNYISMAFTSIVISSLSYAQMNGLDLAILDKVMSKGSNYIPAMPLMISWLEKGGTSFNFLSRTLVKM
ncbi:NAD(P)-dependent oxidoreductase [Paenibacillus hexagrammi]|uniref:NAD(P)-binding domain-containing protein n=1 Tax=Paenibacillus hexagrammi TaxID=2908839 RepID=A0ABY3SQZ6_9BACL|nr:NAD(P)-binding domain-containing protein [Paenibacillus sp. YPD9-1]UJF35530.1 NAD(P)-binding domain-containing protein [Paenibacillus sp. YPD9-1]